MRLAESIFILLLLVAACRERERHGFKEPPPEGAAVTCPVSASRCTKGPETPSAVYESATYYFCSKASHQKFLSDPAAFADP